MAAALLAGLIAGAFVFWPRGEETKVEFIFNQDGANVTRTLHESEALHRAEEVVRSPVLAAQSLPKGFRLTTVLVREDSDDSASKINVDLGATDLIYRSEVGRFISIHQWTLATRTVSWPNGWTPLEIPGVAAAILQSTGSTSLAWNGSNGHFSALYRYDDEVFAAGAQQLLIEMMASMR